MAIPGPLIGVVHLLPLPGSASFRGKLETVLDRAVEDARAYARGGMDALIVENFGDAPFRKDRLAPATVAAMTLATAAVRDAVPLPLGVNALRNDAFAALGVAAATGASFVRVNVLAGVVATDQGLIEGDAAGVLEERARLGSRVRIAADVDVKHARTLHSTDIGSAARDLVHRSGADAVIVSGSGTGHPTDPAHLEAVRAAIGRKPTLWVGSGVDASSVRDLLSIADGVIVGTALKKGGRTRASVDRDRVRAFVRAARR